MELKEQQRKFIETRSKFVKTWPVVGTGLLVVTLGLGTWLFLTKPLLANPFFVLNQLKNNAVSLSTLTLMAGFLPLVILLCLILVIAVIVFAFAAFSNEKKYLAIIKSLVEK